MHTVNIGLISNKVSDKGAEIISPRAVLQWLLDARKVSRVAIQKSISEPTLVVGIDAPLNDAEAYALCAAFEQDCIAQSADGINGALLGPKSAEWGAFNAALFIRLS
jgi:hypothetical protein